MEFVINAMKLVKNALPILHFALSALMALKLYKGFAKICAQHKISQQHTFIIIYLIIVIIIYVGCV